MTNPSLADLLPCLRRTALAARYRDLNDRELLQGYLTGKDQGAFDALLFRHAPRVFAVCRQVLGDGADLEDAFQATFLVLLDKGPRIDWHDSLGNWLAVVAHRTAVRARSRKRRCAVREAKMKDGASSEATGESELLWREARAILHEELDHLPDRFRLPLLLCYLEGLSRDEAANRLGWSLGSVKAGLERGRARLRQRLLQRGVTLSAGLLSALATSATARGPSQHLLLAARQAAAGSAPPGVAALASGVVADRFGRKVLLVLGLLLAFLGVATCQHLIGENKEEKAVVVRDDPPAPGDADERRVVRGQVLTPKGKPVSGAAVYRLDWIDWNLPVSKWEQTKVATTGPDGRFTVAVARRCLVAACAAGFAPDCSTEPLGDDLTLTLADDRPIRGQLLGPDRQPIARAKVRVLAVMAPEDGSLQPAYNAFRVNPDRLYAALPKRLQGGLAELPAEVRTDEQGRFVLRGVGRGRIAELRFEATDIVSDCIYAVTAVFDPKTIAATDAERKHWAYPNFPFTVYGPTFTHVARSDEVIRGTVVAAGTGTPLEGVTVVGIAVPFGSSDRPTWNDDARATTDRAGRFVLAGLPRGRRRFLHAQAGKNPYLNRIVEIKDAKKIDSIAIELRRAVVLEGHLTDGVTGKLVNGFVSYRPSQDNEEFKRQLKTNEYPGGFGLPTPWTATLTDDGRFRLYILPGPGVVMASAGRAGSPPARFRAAHIAPSDRKYQPPPKARDDESGFAMLLEMLFGTWGNSSGNDEDDERLEIAPWCRLRRIHAYAIVNPDAKDEVVRCPIQLDRGGTVTGKVVGPDGKPLSGAKAVGIQGPDERRATTFRTDAFTAYGVDSSARARPLFFIHEERKLAGTLLLRGDETGTPVVKMRPWASAIGRVLDADGTPVAGADLSVKMTNEVADVLIARVLYRSRRLKSDKDGRFRIEGLFPGQELQVSASKPGYFTPGIVFPARTPWAGKVVDLGEMRFPHD